MNPIRVRHFLLNVAGAVVPIGVALVAFPVIAKLAGPARLGFMGLAWTVIGYLGLLDFGLSRVVVRRVARARSPEEFATERAVVLRLAGTLLALSIPVALALAFTLPLQWLLGTDTAGGMLEEVRSSWWIVMATVPIVVVANVLGGTLDGRQWFGLANALKIVFGCWTFLAPMAVALAGEVTLPWLVLSVAVGRFLALLSNAIAAHAALPRFDPVGTLPAFGSIMAEGGWLTITNIVGPVMARLDRFVVSAKLSLTAAAFYIVPQEFALRLILIPAALSTTLFPALARAHAEDPLRHQRVWHRGIRAACAMSLPIALALAILSPWGLDRWMGEEFSRHSATVAAILAVGMFANSIALVPYTAIQAAGRADITAKTHLAELPLFVGALWALIGPFGIEGAALAWSLRCLIDCFALTMLASKLAGREHEALGFADVITGLALCCAAAASVLWLPGQARPIAGPVLFGAGLLVCTYWLIDLRAAQR